MHYSYDRPVEDEDPLVMIIMGTLLDDLPENFEQDLVVMQSIQEISGAFATYSWHKFQAMITEAKADMIVEAEGYTPQDIYDPLSDIPLDTMEKAETIYRVADEHHRVAVRDRDKILNAYQRLRAA